VGKSLQVGKKGVKLFLVVDDRILYIENPEENTLTHSLTHSHIRAKNEFSKNTRHKNQYSKKSISIDGQMTICLGSISID
jgi:hypothetical protein